MSCRPPIKVLSCILLVVFLHLELLTTFSYVCGSALPIAQNASGDRIPRETCVASNGMAFIEIFPNAENCSSFWNCYEIQPGVPHAVETFCPIFVRDGEIHLLSFNFEKCVCDYPENTQCYDFDLHITQRYNCAKLLNKTLIA